jgi:hypothetical protein
VVQGCAGTFTRVLCLAIEAEGSHNLGSDLMIGTACMQLAAGAHKWWLCNHHNKGRVAAFMFAQPRAHHQPSHKLSYDIVSVMEVVSLSIGAVALAALLNNAVDCFNYVRVAQSTGRDFQTCLLRLQNLQLRLSRWGEGVGLTAFDDDSIRIPFSANEQQKIRPLLEHIIRLFESADKEAMKQGTSRKTSSKVPEEAAHQDITSLCKKMKDIYVERQRNTDLSRKTVSALHSKAELTHLISGLQDLIDDLVELYPPTDRQCTERALCSRETQALREEVALPELHAIALTQDGRLAEAINAQVGSTYA